ncbi:MAG TPA: hypothetical protein VGL14_18560 [Methylomirabilota bacterium]|jgi:hypothetical protein
MAEDKTNIWKMTSIGLVIAAIVAVVTGIVVANRTGTETKVVAPSASPATTAPSASVAQAPTTSAPGAQPTPAPPSKGVPPQSVIAECNRVAGDMSGPERTRNEKIVNAAKDAGIGALGGAAVGALGGGIASGGKGAGKGALIGGGVGAGAGTLYGIYDNKKHDERYRSAYIGCMKSKGYTA